MLTRVSDSLCCAAETQHWKTVILQFKKEEDFTYGPVVKESPVNAVDTGSIPGLGRLHMPRGS